DLHLGVLDLPEQLHQLQTRLWGGAVDHPDGDRAGVLHPPGHPFQPESVAMTALAEGSVRPAAAEHVSRAAGESRPVGYLVGAVCIAVSTIMLAPLVLSFLASIKSPDEARAVPPTYI